MRPLLSIDYVALIGFAAILIIIGIFPTVISPIVEAGVRPVVQRLDQVQQAGTVLQSVQSSAIDILNWLGGAL
jgi:hypothetical protein